jgi:hypothetical protein
MMHKIARSLLVAGLCAAFLFQYGLLVESASLVQTPAQITFSRSRIENHYPESLSFFIKAESSDSEIDSAMLFYATRDATSTTRQIVEIEPANQVELSYTWDTNDITIPPSTPIVYHWEVVDTLGNRSSSEEETIYYDDVRYAWNILENENIAVWWHDRSSSFGDDVFEIAQEAFNEQQKMFRSDPEYQIRIITYNSFEEFAEWHSFVSEFTGGQAFPSIGVTTQIVSAYSSVDRWLSDVVPHEISHLYFYQATYHPSTNPPAWLNEGLAQLNQSAVDTRAIELAQSEIAWGNLLPLWSLSGSFGYDETDVLLAYAESLSAAVFISERYGNEGISKLLAAYKSGLSDDAALVKGLGVTLFELQREWLAWMGVDPDMYPTPTAEPTIAWPTPPSYSTATRLAPTRTATSEPVSTHGITTPPAPSAEKTIEQTIVEIPVTSPPDPREATPEISESPPVENPAEGQGGSPICGLAAIPLLLAAFATFKLRYST